jgi:hypothetical protein
MTADDAYRIRTAVEAVEKQAANYRYSLSIEYLQRMETAFYKLTDITHEVYAKESN